MNLLLSHAVNNYLSNNFRVTCFISRSNCIVLSVSNQNKILITNTSEVCSIVHQILLLLYCVLMFIRKKTFAFPETSKRSIVK